MICIISDVQPLSLSMLWRMGLVRHSCTRSLRSACARPGSRPPGLRCGEPHPGLGALHRRSVPITESAPVVDEGEAHMQACPEIGTQLLILDWPRNVWHHPWYQTPRPHQIERIWETPQHVRFPTIKTTVPGNASRMPMEEADWPVPRRMVTQSEALH